MKTILKDGSLVLIPETSDEENALHAWGLGHEGHVFVQSSTGGSGYYFRSLGPREIACREPINIISTVADESLRLISNFAPAPFTMDGREYACVEAFWQGLKFEEESDRRRIAALSGPEARVAGQEKGYGASITYEGIFLVPGTRDHWDLMQRACRAKFGQNPAAAAALLSTGTRPLTHRVRRDSRTIPGVIMAAIWMRLRDALARGDKLER